MTDQTGILYIVATPIGNLKDISERALETFKSVDLIAAEDTRHSGILLSHYGIKKPFFALHDHNEQQKTQALIDKLKEGMNVALISDAGTPLISDPGFHVVRQCREEQIKVSPIPGACAAIAALSSAGVASDKFCFEGFLPAKPKARRDALSAIANESRTLIYYESTHRLEHTLTDIEACLGENRYVVLARELTKTWETITGAPVGELKNWVISDKNRSKGEMVLIIEGSKKPKDNNFSPEALKALQLIQQELPLKKAAAIVAKLYGYKKNALYDYGLEKLKDK